jgi:D-glycero-alpha-D-manno-heptose-7-phosphate kinase
MIICKTPYRISFFGGGTDFPDWYNRYGGKVISTSINKYSYIVIRNLPEIFKYKFRIRYYFREETNFKTDIKHPVVRELLKLNKSIKNIDITHHGDLPARTGIGSSSSFTVGLIHSLNALQKKNINKKQLSELAIFFEQGILKETVGSQDQVIVSYGGFRSINFEKRKVSANLINNKNFINKLEKWCQVFYLGNQRNASKLEEKKFGYINRDKKIILKKMMELTETAERLILSKNKNNFYDFIKLLDEQWKLKKNLDTAVSSANIDEMYEFSKKHGAISGKILGAGGGGFFLLITPPQFQRSLEKKIKLPKINIKFENNGSQIIFNSKD